MLRGAIIGIGKIAQTGHLPAFTDERIRARAEIVAAVDPSAGSRNVAAGRFPSLRLYETMQELFDHEDIQFIDICTTPKYHGELIETALRHNVHILCEKPLSISGQEAARIVGLLQQTKDDVVFMPCHQYRYSPLWRQFKSFIADTNAAGSLLQFSVYRTEADPGLHQSNEIWRMDRAVSGGGILADTGVHYLYLSLWMLGVPRRVSARIHHLANRKEHAEDTAIVVLEHDKGVVEITLTWGADRRANSARLVNRVGSLVYDGNSLVRYRAGSKDILPVPDASDKRHYVQLYVHLIDEFLTHIQDGSDTLAWSEEAFQSVKLLEACYKSAASGQLVGLD